MQLVTAYKNMFIGRMFPDTLLKILKGEHPLITVKDVRNGVIMLSNGTILKCVGDCYERLDKTVVPKNTNLFLKCRNTRKMFKLDDVDDTNCTTCHIRCLALEQSQSIKRRQRTKSKRSKIS